MTGFLVAGFSRCLGATGQENLNSIEGVMLDDRHRLTCLRLDFKFSQASQLFAEAEQARLRRLGGYQS